MINWEFVNEGMKSIQWLRNCNDLPKRHGENSISLTIGEVWQETFNEDDQNHRLLNPSILFMSAYLYFIYPKESVEFIDISNISISKFVILKEDKKHNKREFIKRLRNSIAHANFYIQNDIINFIDFKPKDHSNYIEFQISTVEFGDFIEEFRLQLFNQSIKNLSK